MKLATALEKRHMGRVAELPCLVCGGRSTIHHVTGFADKPGRMTRSHKLVVPLCPMHHQAVHDPYANRPVSVERLSHQGFYRVHGIDLFAVAQRLWDDGELA